MELTERENLVLHLLDDGLTAQGIAARLLLSRRTVHKHLERISCKLDAHAAVRRSQPPANGLCSCSTQAASPEPAPEPLPARPAKRGNSLACPAQTEDHAPALGAPPADPIASASRNGIHAADSVRSSAGFALAEAGPLAFATTTRLPPPSSNGNIRRFEF